MRVDFNLQCELATRRAAGRVNVELKPDITRFHRIGRSDQPHEFFSCNVFFWPGSILICSKSSSVTEENSFFDAILKLGAFFSGLSFEEFCSCLVQVQV